MHQNHRSNTAQAVPVFPPLLGTIALSACYETVAGASLSKAGFRNPPAGPPGRQNQRKPGPKLMLGEAAL